MFMALHICVCGEICTEVKSPSACVSTALSANASWPEVTVLISIVEPAYTSVFHGIGSL